MRSKLYIRSVTLVTLILFPVLAFKTIAADCDGKDLPQDIRIYLEQQSNDWRIIGVSDLSPDDQAEWLRENTHSCPGIVVGAFKPAAGELYAVALLSKTLRRYVKILVFENSDKKYKPTIVADSFDAGSVPVLFKAPPGSPEEWETRLKIKMRNPGIQLVFFGGSNTIFYWSNGKFRVLQVSD